MLVAGLLVSIVAPLSNPLTQRAIVSSTRTFSVCGQTAGVAIYEDCGCCGFRFLEGTNPTGIPCHIGFGFRKEDNSFWESFPMYFRFGGMERAWGKFSFTSPPFLLSCVPFNELLTTGTIEGRLPVVWLYAFRWPLC